MDKAGLNLMLIDDNDADNEYHQEMVQGTEISHLLNCIEDAREALQYFRNCFLAEKSEEFPLPDLIFLDINMPAVNGFEFLDEIRMLPDPYAKRRAMKIFMLSGSLNPDDQNLATEKYGDLILGFRIKPLTKPVILSIIRDHFPAYAN